MARYDIFVCSYVNHLEWRDNCINIYFSHLKGGQERLNRNDLWHIYLNPLCPDTFPVISRANYVLTYPTLLKGCYLLFPGDYQYNRFMRILCGVLK